MHLKNKLSVKRVVKVYKLFINHLIFNARQTIKKLNWWVFTFQTWGSSIFYIKRFYALINNHNAHERIPSLHKSSFLLWSLHRINPWLSFLVWNDWPIVLHTNSTIHYLLEKASGNTKTVIDEVWLFIQLFPYKIWKSFNFNGIFKEFMKWKINGDRRVFSSNS